MTDEYKILYMLVGTFCSVIIMAVIGVAVKMIDVQFVEGMVSGGLLTLITMLFKDILNKGESNEKANTSSSVSGNPIVK